MIGKKPSFERRTHKRYLRFAAQVQKGLEKASRGHET